MIVVAFQLLMEIAMPLSETNNIATCWEFILITDKGFLPWLMTSKRVTVFVYKLRLPQPVLGKAIGKDMEQFFGSFFKLKFRDKAIKAWVLYSCGRLLFYSYVHMLYKLDILITLK